MRVFFIFPKSNFSKMDVIAGLVFKLAYDESIVLTITPPGYSLRDKSGTCFSVAISFRVQGLDNLATVIHINTVISMILIYTGAKINMLPIELELV